MNARSLERYDAEYALLVAWRRANAQLMNSDAWFKAMYVVERCERTMVRLDQVVRPAS